MSSHPYLALFTGDFKKDAQLSLCSPATRGIWIDLLCSFHDGQIGELRGTAEQFARLCRCNTAEMEIAIKELGETGTANVEKHDDGSFTVTSRRMKKVQELQAKRKQAGSKGGSKREAKPEQTLENENEIENDFSSSFGESENLSSSFSKTEANAKQNPNKTEAKRQQNALDKVREFARGEGISLADSDWFFYHCESNGWTNGGRPIRDWRATLRSWQRAGYLPSQKAAAAASKTASKSQAKTGGPVVPKEKRETREPTAEEWQKARETAESEAAAFREKFRAK